MANRPAPQIELTESLVRGLLRSQHPDMADLDVSVLARGWDNTNFKLGSDHLVRLPHREEAAELIVNEQRWLPEIARRVDVPISAATHVGVPDDLYPWHWSITPWFPGAVAALSPAVNTTANAAVLGTFLDQLHIPAPDDAPANPHRGGPVATRHAAFTKNLEVIDIEVGQAELIQIFEDALSVTPSSERVWLHGDLHGRNMIVDEGRLSAVIDWGDICVGDRATDLAAAYMVVPDHLGVVQDLAGASPDDWARARGWAVHFAVMYIAFGDDDEVLADMGHRLIQTLLETT